MCTVKLHYSSPRPWRWNTDKTVKVSVDGKYYATYWGIAKEELTAIIKARLNVRRVRTEVSYGD